MLGFLRILFGVLTLGMATLIIVTSLQSNLWAEGGALLAEPWMRTTLVDFYIVLLPSLLWLWLREGSVLPRVLWSIAFIVLGGLGTSAYIFLVLLKARPGQPWRDILLPRGEPTA
jgi:hypothetical protein